MAESVIVIDVLKLTWDLLLVLLLCFSNIFRVIVHLPICTMKPLSKFVTALVDLSYRHIIHIHVCETPVEAA